MKASTTTWTVSSDHCSRGSFKFSLSRHRATIDEVLPYPENWPCNVSTGLPSVISVNGEFSQHMKEFHELIAMCLRLIEPLIPNCQHYAHVYFPNIELTYHFSIKLPSTHLTISPRSHSMSTEGSYPRVAFPSASVVPLTSTT